MKLRRQAPAKLFIVAASAGLMAALFGLVRAEPRINAALAPEPTPAVNYDRFFAPPASPAPAAATPEPPARAPHTRTQAS